MPLPHRIESALGFLTLEAVRRVQKRTLGARVHVHRDARGRVTPYLEVGTARRGTLVWLHGFGDRFDTILQVAPSLMKDWQIVAPSMPGFGEGWVDPEEHHTFGAYADWMEGVLRDVVPGRFHLMGNSLGGATALAVAARMSDEVRSVVALNAAGVVLDDVHCAHAEMRGGDNLFEVRTPEDYERFQKRIFAEPMKMPRTITAHLFDEQVRQADWFVRVGRDLATSDTLAEGDGWSSYIDLPAVSVPALALWGDQDTLFPVEHGERMASEMPNGHFERIDGVGHCAHFESPKRLAAAFSSWAVRMS